MIGVAWLLLSPTTPKRCLWREAGPAAQAVNGGVDVARVRRIELNRCDWGLVNIQPRGHRVEGGPIISAQQDAPAVLAAERSVSHADANAIGISGMNPDVANRIGRI